LQSDPAATFLDWEHDKFTRKDTAIITVRARRACKKLGVGLKLEASILVIKTGESEKKKCCHWNWPLSDSESHWTIEAEEPADEGEARSNLC
jgi:hypothetical protein